MSNPGVLQLAEKEINGRSFRIEDNIGEAIHVHFGDMRFDMTIKEFLNFERQIADIVNEMIDADGVNVRELDPLYLLLGLGDFVNLEKADNDTVKLSSLVTDTMDPDGTERFISITDSRVVNALNGDYDGLTERRQINLYGDDNESRLEKILQSIKEHGYPYKNGYIILYNDGIYIRDGLHRASCLYHLHGDIEVPVLRLYFRENAYSDEQREAESKKKRILLKLQQMCKCGEINSADVIQPLYKQLMNTLLEGKKVAIKGAGKHTQEVLKLLDKNIDLKCIIANETKIEIPEGVEVITNDEIKHHDIETILLSAAAYRYRQEMAEEIFDATTDLDGDYQVLDIYKVMENLGVQTRKSILRPEPVRDDIVVSELKKKKALGIDRFNFYVHCVESIGDVVACEPIARYLKNLEPDSKVTWMVKENAAEVVKWNPYIDEVIEVKCLSESSEIIDEMRKEASNIIVDCHYDGRECSHTRKAHRNPNNPQIGEFTYLNFGPLLTSFCLIAGLEGLAEAPVFHQSPNVTVPPGLPERYVVFHCKSAERARDWDDDKWNTLAHMIINAGYNVVEVGLKPVIDIGDDGYFNCTNLNSIQIAAEIIKQSVCFIGIDSVFAHIANCLGIYGILLLGKYRDFDRPMTYTGNYACGIRSSAIYAERGMPAKNISVEKVFREFKCAALRSFS